MSKALSILLLSAVVVGALGVVSPASANNDFLHQCLKDARTEYGQCTNICKDNLQSAIAVCRQTHPCEQTCAENRHACRTPILNILQASIKACNNTLRDAIKLCRHDTTDPVLRDACIDAAQIVALICRDDAHESAQPLLNQCKEDFRACILHCHP
jgi:hypothetical protein